MSQFIIAIDREFGSGGREIAQILADRFQVPLYHHNITKILHNQGVLHHAEMHRYDENPRNIFFSRTVRGMTNSHEESLAMRQFDFLKEQARAGESFVVLGHCAEEILKHNPNLISIFISADEDFKIARTVYEEGLSADDARLFMRKKSKDRKTYHNAYCTNKWGDSRCYDLCLRSSSLGIDKSADFIEDYLKLRLKGEQQ